MYHIYYMCVYIYIYVCIMYIYIYMYYIYMKINVWSFLKIGVLYSKMDAL
jgi:hypothetical protein